MFSPHKSYQIKHRIHFDGGGGPHIFLSALAWGRDGERVAVRVGVRVRLGPCPLAI